MNSLKPDLDTWLPETTMRVSHRREAHVSSEALWRAASEVPLTEAGRLGRLIRWRIPGLSPSVTFDALFRQPPFIVLDEGDQCLVSGLVGRIWTLRRDYPQLHSPEEFRDWSKRGTARVVFANWVQDNEDGAALISEARVEGMGAQGRMGVAAVRPLVRAFQNLVGSEGIAAAVRRAERGG